MTADVGCKLAHYLAAFSTSFPAIDKCLVAEVVQYRKKYLPFSRTLVWALAVISAPLFFNVSCFA
jgi:hypothetical protein